MVHPRLCEEVHVQCNTSIFCKPPVGILTWRLQCVLRELQTNKSVIVDKTNRYFDTLQDFLTKLDVQKRDLETA